MKGFEEIRRGRRKPWRSPRPWPPWCGSGAAPTASPGRACCSAPGASAPASSAPAAWRPTSWPGSRRCWTAGRPHLAAYDLSSDLDLVWGTGMGCQGRADVLLERVDPGPAAALDAALRRPAGAAPHAAPWPRSSPPGRPAVRAGDHFLLARTAADWPGPAASPRPRRRPARALAAGAPAASPSGRGAASWTCWWSPSCRPSPCGSSGPASMPGPWPGWPRNWAGSWASSTTVPALATRGAVPRGRPHRGGPSPRVPPGPAPGRGAARRWW